MSLIPKKGTVYVVDDDEAVRDSLQWLLEGKDYRVRCFDSAESFLSRYDPREVACLIVDIRMGGMTGLELQDKLVERRSPLPIVFITGHGDVPMAVDTMKKGAMDFIQKPFKEDDLVNLVERMLDSARESFSDHQNAANRDALHAVLQRLQWGQVLLATVGSTAPFVGLLGTVWGIFHALTGIATAGQLSIEQVAGPVGESLIMTAAGLGVALPAVLAFNVMGRMINRLEHELEGFAHDVRAL